MFKGFIDETRVFSEDVVFVVRDNFADAMVMVVNCGARDSSAASKLASGDMRVIKKSF